ncbi:MAG TPA: hypothetical protein VIH50_02200 [Steroidobacteraceae bacterium]
MEALVVERPGAAGANSAPESSKSAVSWPAIIAGAVAATAASILLLTLGSGLGLTSVSPWPGSGASAGKAITLAIIWFIVVQWIASFLGAYLTGRLRTKWVGTHTHEVFFRDTAHGFIAWALATLLLALVFTSATVALARTGVHGAALMGAGAAGGLGMAHDPMGPSGGPPIEHEAHGPMGGPGMGQGAVGGYDIDVLFRSTQPESSITLADVHAEASHILMKAVESGEIAPADRDYLAQLIASRTGIAPADAQRRIDDVFARLNAAATKARQAADAARKAAATTSIFLALSMLIGAFIACAAAALGGHERDLHP